MSRVAPQKINLGPKFFTSFTPNYKAKKHASQIVDSAK